MNNRFILHHSRLIASQVARSSPRDAVVDLFRTILSRDPDREELVDWAAHLEARGAAEVARLMFNLSEFVFVD
jgi:hypothetical protein